MEPNNIHPIRSTWVALLVMIIAAGLIGAVPLPPTDAPVLQRGPRSREAGQVINTRGMLTNINSSSSTNLIYLPLVMNGNTNQISYYEGFEGGVLPSGWSVIRLNQTATWRIGSENPHGGNFNAILDYDPSEPPQDQNEVLLSPVFTGSYGTVSMYTAGSIFHCRPEPPLEDLCDLKVWLVKGGWGGLDDTMVKLVDEDWLGNFEDTLTVVDLRPWLSSGDSWQVAWQYTAHGESASVYLDDVVITYGP